MNQFPIRVRLTAWYTIALGIAMLVLALTMYSAMRRAIVVAADGELRSRLEAIAPFIDSRLHGKHATELPHEFETHLSGVQPGGELLQVADSQRLWVYQSDSILPYHLPMPLIQHLNEPRFETVTASGTSLRIVSEMIQVDGVEYNVELAQNIGDYYGLLNRFALLAAWFFPGVLLLSSAGGYWLCRKALSPVDEIAKRARTISAHNLNMRLSIPKTRDELQRLSETLNDMMARLDTAFKRIAQFTADASHELRTPIALIRTTSELALRNPESLEHCVKALQRINLNAERSTHLIATLMELARADSGAQGLNISSTSLSEAITDACDQMEVCARVKQITFTRTILGEVFVYGDPEALRRLFLVLIDNAVKYTPSGGSISVLVSRSGNQVVCVVSDSGVGIPSHAMPHIFERFYRVDQARSRESGGAGLGLAIARWIADAHRASIEVESTVGHGSMFRVSMTILEPTPLGAGSRYSAMGDSCLSTERVR